MGTSISRHLTCAAAAVALAAAGMTAGAATAAADPAQCSVARSPIGATASCPAGSFYLVETRCIGLGNSSDSPAPPWPGIYVRSSYFSDNAGNAAVSCMDGAFNAGIALDAWVRFL